MLWRRWAEGAAVGSEAVFKGAIRTRLGVSFERAWLCAEVRMGYVGVTADRDIAVDPAEARFSMGHGALTVVIRGGGARRCCFFGGALRLLLLAVTGSGCGGGTAWASASSFRFAARVRGAMMRLSRSIHWAVSKCNSS